MRRLTQVALVGVLLLAMGSLAAAQQTPQPVVRLGNFIEVGNDVFMHIMATADIRYKTSTNADFEERVRDRALSRNPSSTAVQEQTADLSYAELRFGAEFKYQKNLHFYLLFENQSVFDGNLIDDRSNTSNPGGTSVFGTAASTENPGFRVERYWVRYKFDGTPVTLHVGADLWSISQAGIHGNDNPRVAILGDFGALQLYAQADIEREAQRLGLTNDNDQVNYAFGGTYDLKQHRFGFDVVYYRDRFSGADTQTVGLRDIGWTGQKHDSVWINASWSGRLGPVRTLVQGNVVTGTAHGGTAGLPAGISKDRRYDILAEGVVAYAELDLGIVRPFVGLIYGSPDGDPKDNKLHGFQAQTLNDSTQITATPFFSHLDTSPTFALRDYSCPALAQGVRTTAPANNPYVIGAQVLGQGSGVTECSHSTSNVFNSRFGFTSHVGLLSTYSNPGTLVIPAGLRVFPLKGHEVTGWFVYRAMLDTSILETAFAPELAGRSIAKTQYYGVGGFWMWTLNPYFDIRVDGEIAIPGEGYETLAKLADCNTAAAGLQACNGNDTALRAGVRFRARF